MTTINHSLVPFAVQLEQLMALDRLSSPHLNCYDAVAGIYDSLRRIFDWEKRRLKLGRPTSEEGDGDEMVEREVMCCRSGRPRMHTRDRTGLSLEYWMRQRCVREKKRKRSSSQDDDTKVDVDDDGKIWRMVIECEASPATDIYPSVRVSDRWVSERVMMNQPSLSTSNERDDHRYHHQDGAEMIDWLEPPATYVPVNPAEMTTTPSGLDGSEPISKLPDVHFIATFEPPIVVPLHVAYQIYGMVGAPMPREALRDTTYDEVVMEEGRQRLSSSLSSTSSSSSSLQSSTIASQTGTMKASIRKRKMIVFQDDDDDDDDDDDREREGKGRKKSEVERTREHDYGFYVWKPEYGQVITKITFGHPRQLIAILPVSNNSCAL